MIKTSIDRTASDDRRKADRLRAIRDRLRSLGKKGLVDLFAAGEMLEEAASLHDGTFSAWVKIECGIEPRTALGYRKTFLVLGPQRAWLSKLNVSPSVALTIACASPEGRERALAAIASGRRLSVAEAKLVVRNSIAPALPSEKLDVMRRAARALSKRFARELELLAEAAAEVEASVDATPGDLATRARALLPFATALSALSNSASGDDMDAFLEAIAKLADPDGETAAAAVGPFEARSEDVEAERQAASELTSRRVSMRSLSSTFDHQLTALEICAGAGGQAAGLAKAGFRHVALVERDPSACETLRAAFGPDHVVETDLVHYDPVDLDTVVDLLAGGVPCQPYSKSGKREGARDERDLFPEALRLVERLRPRAVLLENVMGIFEPDNDMHRFRILSRLRKLGYSVEWGKVDATHFGVAQKRIRAILVAFREPAAMARFTWPAPAFGYGETPASAVSSLFGHLTSREWQPTDPFLAAMDRPSPTITGGSDRKQGIDFGQRKSALVWGEMGFVQTRIGDAPPPAGHEGPVEATNAMLATLQAFPFDWPFRGSKKSIFRQIANAFPAPVAIHLGCAIASALTGRTFDPVDQHVHEAMRWNHVRRPPSPAALARQQRAITVSQDPQRAQLPLATLRTNTVTIEDA